MHRSRSPSALSSDAAGEDAGRACVGTDLGDRGFQHLQLWLRGPPWRLRHPECHLDAWTDGDLFQHSLKGEGQDKTWPEAPRVPTPPQYRGRGTASERHPEGPGTPAWAGERTPRHLEGKAATLSPRTTPAPHMGGTLSPSFSLKGTGARTTRLAPKLSQLPSWDAPNTRWAGHRPRGTRAHEAAGPRRAERLWQPPPGPARSAQSHRPACSGRAGQRRGARLRPPAGPWTLPVGQRARLQQRHQRLPGRTEVLTAALERRVPRHPARGPAARHSRAAPHCDEAAVAGGRGARRSPAARSSGADARSGSLQTEPAANATSVRLIRDTFRHFPTQITAQEVAFYARCYTAVKLSVSPCVHRAICRAGPSTCHTDALSPSCPRRTVPELSPPGYLNAAARWIARSESILKETRSSGVASTEGRAHGGHRGNCEGGVGGVV